jgi:hypothetical protein
MEYVFSAHTIPFMILTTEMSGWVLESCSNVVAKDFICIMSNQGVWYLGHLDVPWRDFYTSKLIAGISMCLVRIQNL